MTSGASAEVSAATLSPAALSIQKSAASSSTTVGFPVNFVLVVTNTGQAAGANVQISDTIASGLSIGAVTIAPAGSCGVTGQAVACTVAALAGGSSVTVTIPVTPAAPGDYQNVATALLQGGGTVQSGQVGFRAVPQGIPGLSPWGMLALAASLTALGWGLLRRT